MENIALTRGKKEMCECPVFFSSHFLSPSHCTPDVALVGTSVRSLPAVVILNPSPAPLDHVLCHLFLISRLIGISGVNGHNNEEKAAQLFQLLG